MTGPRRRMGTLELERVTDAPRPRPSRAEARPGARPAGASVAPRAVAAVGVASALMLLAGCSTYPSDGVVVTGADGEDYVVPDGTERPVYASREDCVADIESQLAKLRADGNAVTASADELCEDASEYHGGHAYPTGVWLGPLLFSGSRWDSPRVSSWSAVGTGDFAKPGSVAHSDVVEKAPTGATVGQRVPLSGGFGTSGKASGFGSSAKAVHGSSFGG
ncbi:hypothetical protein ACDF64_04340 [Agromyces sp. MMS24-JH15]|uniref:hypothetical protein n=1 Tax=Agromyces sp. MMS24-JH15 TaxID=3243765 RepID=UPI00374926D8